MRIFSFLFASLLSGLTVYLFRKQVNLSLMRFFRNLSRYKARKRLYGNEAALIPLLMGQEKDVIAAETLLSTHSPQEEEEVDFYMTAEQLASMNGATESTPLYLCIKGRIYDVSTARDTYGPGTEYYVFIGKDATRAFATGCLEPECVISSTEGLSEEELKEIDRWVDLYQNHDKYQYVGKLLASDPIDSVVDQEIESPTPNVEEIHQKVPEAKPEESNVGDSLSEERPDSTSTETFVESVIEVAVTENEVKEDTHIEVVTTVTDSEESIESIAEEAVIGEEAASETVSIERQIEEKVEAEEATEVIESVAVGTHIQEEESDEL